MVVVFAAAVRIKENAGARARVVIIISVRSLRARQNDRLLSEGRRRLSVRISVVVLSVNLIEVCK